MEFTETLLQLHSMEWRGVGVQVSGVGMELEILNF
jgi:hypothetical protein